MTSNGAPFADDSFALPSLSLGPVGKSEAHEAGLRLAAMDPWRTLGYRPDALASYLLRIDPALRRFSAQLSGKMAGVVCIRHPWLLGPYIEAFALFDSCRGTGLGREILSWIELQAAGGGLRNIWATVSSFNAEARSFYRRFGFIEAASLKALVRPGYDEILIRKEI